MAEAAQTSILVASFLHDLSCWFRPGTSQALPANADERVPLFGSDPARLGFPPGASVQR